MDAGHMRRHEPRLLLLAIYSTVIGMVTEVEVLRAFGEEPTARSLVRRRNEILELLRSALVTDCLTPARARSVRGLGRLALPPGGLRSRRWRPFRRVALVGLGRSVRHCRCRSLLAWTGATVLVAPAGSTPPVGGGRAERCPSTRPGRLRPGRRLLLDLVRVVRGATWRGPGTAGPASVELAKARRHEQGHESDRGAPPSSVAPSSSAPPTSPMTMTRLEGSAGSSPVEMGCSVLDQVDDDPQGHGGARRHERESPLAIVEPIDDPLGGRRCGWRGGLRRGRPAGVGRLEPRTDPIVE